MAENQEINPDNQFSFSWDKLGDIKKGRPNLGEEAPVLTYRFLEYSLNNVLFRHFGAEQTNDLFREAGYEAGTEFARIELPSKASEGEYLAAIASSYLKLKMGIFRVERFDSKAGTFVVTISEDLGCSGLPDTGELVCSYDEGFLSAIFEKYFGCAVSVRETDCWASGAKFCRFQGRAER